MTRSIPWQQAWQEALYGPAGFYRGPGGPAGHFATATQGPSGRVLAGVLWRWADRLGAAGIVDVGAGRGELLLHLRDVRPSGALVGLDVVPRPAALEGVDWIESPGGPSLPDGWSAPGFLAVAHEWLDVVPCVVAEVASDGSLREVLVDPSTGVESLGDPLSSPDRQWCQRFWPSVLRTAAAPGERVEVGRPRDEAWAALLARVPGGAGVAVDYGHLAGARPAKGTLQAYRSGRQVPPVPDGSCDLTAHVAVDSLRHTRLLRQREAVGALGGPDVGLAEADPAAYLGALARRSQVAELRREGGYGDFWWVVATDL